MNVNDESDLGRPLASISATDPIYASGYSGVITFDNTDTSEGSNGTDATFANYAQSVPEPGGWAALAAVIGCAGLSRGLWRRARNEPRA